MQRWSRSLHRQSLSRIRPETICWKCSVRLQPPSRELSRRYESQYAPSKQSYDAPKELVGKGNMILQIKALNSEIRAAQNQRKRLIQTQKNDSKTHHLEPKDRKRVSNEAKWHFKRIKQLRKEIKLLSAPADIEETNPSGEGVDMVEQSKTRRREAKRFARVLGDAEAAGAVEAAEQDAKLRATAPPSPNFTRTVRYIRQGNRHDDASNSKLNLNDAHSSSNVESQGPTWFRLRKHAATDETLLRRKHGSQKKRQDGEGDRKLGLQDAHLTRDVHSLQPRSFRVRKHLATDGFTLREYSNEYPESPQETWHTFPLGREPTWPGRKDHIKSQDADNVSDTELDDSKERDDFLTSEAKYTVWKSFNPGTKAFSKPSRNFSTTRVSAHCTGKSHSLTATALPFPRNAVCPCTGIQSDTISQTCSATYKRYFFGQQRSQHI